MDPEDKREVNRKAQRIKDRYSTDEAALKDIAKQAIKAQANSIKMSKDIERILVECETIERDVENLKRKNRKAQEAKKNPFLGVDDSDSD
ncbi:unnamed protein product [Moneuplotes crassus]|uniref:Uncharacterized protein n=1 Tax=Euplotes crassus TaxID=5936 RepID=A0AAD1Y0M0_EUPCR|nr:unnamed protein product [Moneuplotes crassus]